MANISLYIQRTLSVVVSFYIQRTLSVVVSLYIQRTLSVVVSLYEQRTLSVVEFVEMVREKFPELQALVTGDTEKRRSTKIPLDKGNSRVLRESISNYHGTAPEIQAEVWDIYSTIVLPFIFPLLIPIQVGSWSLYHTLLVPLPVYGVVEFAPWLTGRLCWMLSTCYHH